MRVLSLVRSSLVIVTLLACSSERAMGPVAAPEAAPTFSHTSPATPLLVITEVAPNPAATNDSSEFIEVFNAGANEVNLNGFSLHSTDGSGNNPVTVNITTSVPIASGACVLLSTHSKPINGFPVAFVYGTNGSMMFTNGSSIDFMELRQGATVIDRVKVGFNPTNHNGFTFYLIETTNDITLVDNSVITVTNGVAAAPWKKALATDVYGATGAERGTPGVCNYGKHVAVGEVATVTVNPMQIATTLSGVGSASAVDAQNNSVTTTFTWSSSDANIVEITNAATGAFRAVAAGTATLTATAANNVAGSALVTVIDGNAIDRITVSFSNSPTLVPGYQRQAFAQVFNVLGQRIFPVITWSTGDAAIATIDSRGYFTAQASGNTPIIATANGVSGQSTLFIQTVRHPNVTYRNHTDFGDPLDADPADDLILRKREYALSYSTVRGGPVWVSWNLNSTQFLKSGGRPRCDCFSQDQELLSRGVAPENVIGDWDYNGAGYDRGHMVQSASRNITDTQNASTFLMTNMLPQDGDNNQGPWNDMEEYLNGVAASGKEVYIIAGGIYSAAPGTLNNAGKVQIPDYTWKVAVVMTSPIVGVSGVDYFDDFEIIAVNMPNLNSTAVRNIDWKVYKTTVDQIEAATGLDLLHLLADEIENAVEAGDRPPVAAMTVPSSTTEGSAILLDARASSDPDGDALTYTWTLSDGTTLNGALVTHVFRDNGPQTVKLTVRDPLGAWNTKSTTVAVANAAPIATLTSENQTVVSGEVFTVSAGFTDAGTLDNPWTLNMNWGTGSPTVSQTSTQGITSASHTYLQAGSYTVTFTVTDKDGMSSTRSLEVEVVRRAIGLVAQEVINDNDVGNASIKVTALGDANFDVALVDLTTACIDGVCVRERGNSGQVFASTSDVDGDGDLDLVMRFERRALVRVGALPVGTQELVFLANLSDGRQVEGRASVNVH